MSMQPRPWPEVPADTARVARSAYDLDARYSEKHGMGWTGYKGHFTETVSDPAR